MDEIDEMPDVCDCGDGDEICMYCHKPWSLCECDDEVYLDD